MLARRTDPYDPNSHLRWKFWRGHNEQDFQEGGGSRYKETGVLRELRHNQLNSLKKLLAAEARQGDFLSRST
jgi:hypothetical protein